MSRISYVRTYQVAYPPDEPLSDSIHYMPVRAALLVETVIHDELAPRILGLRLWRSRLPDMPGRQPGADDVGPLLPGRRAPRRASAQGRRAVTGFDEIDSR